MADHLNNNNEQTFKYAPASLLNVSKAITSVTVQKDDLIRLNRHLKGITISENPIDWNSILLGAFFSSIISLIWQWVHDKSFPSVYAVLAIVFLCIAYYVDRHQIEKADASHMNHLVNEAKADLADILHKANIVETDYLSQDQDHGVDRA